MSKQIDNSSKMSSNYGSVTIYLYYAETCELHNTSAAYMVLRLADSAITVRRYPDQQELSQ